MSPDDAEALRAEQDVRNFEERNGLFRLDLFLSLDFAHLRPEDRANLGALVEILQKVPNALECKRIRDGVQCLRAQCFFRAKEDIPLEVRKTLLRIGDAIAKPRKIKLAFAQTTERERAILGVWAARKYLDRDARNEVAATLGFHLTEKTPDPWESLQRSARRYTARPFRRGSDKKS